MTENRKKQPNWPLLMPLGLLLVEIIVYAILRLIGVEMTQYLFIFFVLLGFFLLYQAMKQLISLLRVNNAVKKLKTAKTLAESDQPMDAIKLWKKLLLNLPRDKYLEVLTLIEETYQELGMTDAVQQAKTVQTESIKYFRMAENTDRATANDRQAWQNKALELRDMIKSFPESQS